MRCCVYKERAIVQERVRIALGGDKDNACVIEVIDIACDECPISTYAVTESCRGCVAHRCEAACPRGAISFDKNQKAKIDPDKCVECGKCAAVCPYHAIKNHKRPCESACKVKAIARGAHNVAVIQEAKCISCGACVYQCPFGAVSDKSYIVKAIEIIRGSGENRNYRTYCLVAPSISSQFRYAKLGQVISALKRLGFYSVVEAALGADMVAWAEAQELSEKGFLTNSCCPAFVNYIEKQFPQLMRHVSSNLSPMATLAKFIKKSDPTAKVVFIGPCTAKKAEAARAEVRESVDCVLTFEELQALIDCRDFDVAQLEEDVLENASSFGRIFARSGGTDRRGDGGGSGARHRFRGQARRVRRHRGVPHRAAQAVEKYPHRELHRGHGVPRRLHRRRGLPDPRPQGRGRSGQVRRGGARKEDRRRGETAVAQTKAPASARRRGDFTVRAFQTEWRLS